LATPLETQTTQAGSPATFQRLSNVQRKRMAYAYPKLAGVDCLLFRTQGPGLGNLLLPWARSVIAARTYRLSSLAPTWPQVKIGPLLRRESDFRFYGRLFKNAEGDIGGIKKLRLLSTLRKITEYEFARDPDTWAQRDDHLVIFEGPGANFVAIVSDHDLVRTELLKITLPNHQHGLYFEFKYSISVHVRLGDFAQASPSRPISWCISVVTRLRKAMGQETPVYVFSDGKDEELRPLLQLPLVRRLAFGSSIADILALSQANVLIANGGSPFSTWASYLGRMPVIWPPGTNYHKLNTENPSAEIEIQEGQPLPPNFLQQIRSRRAAAIS